MATSRTMLDTELLRLVTAGSVDDGKSTLIGRLLYDTQQILVDQLEHIEETSQRRGDGYVNLALLTDGLRAEREQGITIDVAYRSFVTPRRRFQLADAPGPPAVHAQHGHRRLDRRPRDHPRRRAARCAGADAPARVHRRDPPHPSRRRDGEQDGSRGLLGGALPRDRAGAARDVGAAGLAGRAGDPDLRAARRQRRRARPSWRDSDALVRRADAPRAPRDGGDRRRPRPRSPPLPGPVGDPSDLGRAPRLPRLRRPGRRRRLAGGRRGRRAAVRPADVGGRGRDGRRAAGRGCSRHVRDGAARGRPRRLARRHAGRSRAGADRRAGARGDGLLDGRAPACARARASS